MLQRERSSRESLHLLPNLHPAKDDFVTIQIASESIIIPHIPLTNLQPRMLVLCPCDDEIPRDDSVPRLKVESVISKELHEDDPRIAIPEQKKSHRSAITVPEVEEMH
jgi:hypothetical protein